MRISLFPQRRDDVLTVAKAGDVLTINNETFDFSDLLDGASIPADVIPCKWIVGPVDRVNGVLHLSLILPHGPSPSEGVAFPSPLDVEQDGPITLPGAENVEA